MNLLNLIFDFLVEKKFFLNNSKVPGILQQNLLH